MGSMPLFFYITDAGTFSRAPWQKPLSPLAEILIRENYAKGIHLDNVCATYG